MKTITSITVGLLLTHCTSCTTKPGHTRLAATPIGYPSSIPAQKLSTVDHTEEIPVFIVTGRNLLDDANGVEIFGNERNDSSLPNLAIAKVSVGEGMTSEEIVEDTLTMDGRLGQTRFRLNEIEHVPIAEANLFAVTETGLRRHQNKWIREINSVLNASTERQITIYVHGYNAQFITNTERIAEVSHFSARNGAVINFDWPSRGKVGAYHVDKGNAAYSTRQFRALLLILARETQAERINIIAHSAGNPIVVDAMRELRLLQRHMSPAELQARYKINAVTLSAPDMDLQTFINAAYDRFFDVARGVAVYTSSRDKALQFAKKIFRAQRLGQAAAELKPWEREAFLAVPEIEIIDATAAVSQSNDFLSHNYFHRNHWVSNDVALFSTGLSPEQRFLVKDESSIFWTFPEDYAELVKSVQ